MTAEQPTRYEVTATSLDDNGFGVGQTAEGELRVGDLLPGEQAVVAVDHRSPHTNRAWCHIVKRIGPPSPHRVVPACPGFGGCGGCLWQHLSYPAQLTAKRDRVVHALAEVPGCEASIAPTRPSPEQLGYRNKGKYVVGRIADRIVLGAYRPRSHDLIDTRGCRVVAPIIDEVASWLTTAIEAAAVIPYDERARTGELRYALIRAGDPATGGEVLVALVAASTTPTAKLAEVAARIARHPAVRGVVAIDNDRRDGAIIPSGTSARVLAGSATLTEMIAGARLEVGAGEFLQVNRPQATALYRRVVELAAVAPGRSAVDLFAGLGGIGLHLARAGSQVIAVEIDRDAVGALRRAATEARLPLVAIAGDAADVRGQLTSTPDVMVVNPPRKGLSEAARALIGELGAPTVIYVSCGPDSLARDLSTLAKRGYAADVIEPWDLMPGTSQVETVVRLRRGRK